MPFVERRKRNLKNRIAQVEKALLEIFFRGGEPMRSSDRPVEAEKFGKDMMELAVSDAQVMDVPSDEMHSLMLWGRFEQLHQFSWVVLAAPGEAEEFRRRIDALKAAAAGSVGGPVMELPLKLLRSDIDWLDALNSPAIPEP